MATSKSSGIQGALKKIAMRHAGVAEEVACKGTAVESAVFRVGKKSFLFVGADKARLKLDALLGEAKKIAKAQPASCEVGKLGWVAVTYGPGAPPSGVLEKWIGESYRLAAGPAARPSKR